LDIFEKIKMSIFQKWLLKFCKKRAESIMMQIPKKSFKMSLHNFFHEKIRPEIVIMKMIIMVTKMITFLRAQKLSKIINKPITYKRKCPIKNTCKKSAP